MKNKILLIIFIACLISSVALSLTPTAKVCQDTCTNIQETDYSKTLGIKNSHIGLVVFAFLSLITISHIKRPKKQKKLLINLGVIFGSLVAIYFLYLQQFVMKEFCKYCLVVDIGMLIGLFLIIPKRKK